MEEKKENSQYLRSAWCLEMNLREGERERAEKEGGREGGCHQEPSSSDTVTSLVQSFPEPDDGGLVQVSPCPTDL